MVFLLRLGILMVAYQVLRLGFFVYNRDLFDDVTWGNFLGFALAGVRFDASAVCYTNGLVLLWMLAPTTLRYRRWYDNVALGIFAVCNGLALATNIVDYEYYRFVFKRSTSAVFDEFSHEQHLVSLSGSLLAGHAGLLLWGMVVLGATLWLASRVRPTFTQWLGTPGYYLRHTVGLAAGLYLALVLMRGGLFIKSHRPINNATALQYVEEPHHASLVINTPFSLIRTIDKETLERRTTFVAPEELNARYNPERYPKPATPRFRNVVIFVLESFGSEHLGFLNPTLDDGKYEGFTPFLDSLSQRSFVFTNAFANGLKSIDGLPSVVASIPSLVEPFVISHYSQNRFEGLAAHLGRKGYSSAFFHGAPRGSMGFTAFTKAAGYQQYYGLEDFGADGNDANAEFDGSWGIWDEPFFQYYAQKINTLKPPFLATIFSLSSHEPFHYPAQYEGKLRTSSNPLDACVNYTDQSLEKFFRTAETMPYFKDTLFVITADHASRTSHKIYKNIVGRFRVPIMFYAPGDPDLVGRDGDVAQQLDIMPTILGYLGISDPFVAFGNNLFDPEAQRFAINYRGGTFQFLRDAYALHHDGEKAFALYNYVQDPKLKKNILADSPEVSKPMQEHLEAFLQQFNNRMLDDRLTLVGATRADGR